MTIVNDDSDDQSLDELRKIIAVCERFEEAWRTGADPRLEDYLVSEGIRPLELLSRLLLLELSLLREAGAKPLADVYYKRFPDATSIVDMAFADQTKSVAPAHRGSTLHASERSVEPLLLGIFALQKGFIDHKTLNEALRSWSESKTRGMDVILVELRGLDAPAIELLKAQVEDHKKKNGGDLHKSMEGLDFLDAARLALEQLDALNSDATRTFIRRSDRRTLHIDPPTDDDDFSYDEDSSGSGSTRDGFRCEKRGFHRAGALGKVSRAFDRELKREVAFKEIRDELHLVTTSRSQFMIEGLVSGGLEHPGIVPVYGLGSYDGGKLYYAMRFIQGPSLKERLAQLHQSSDAPPLKPGEERPTLPRLLRHFINACFAAGYAHSRGILHRDIKPEHIMLGPFGETLLVDWGLAMPIAKREPGEGEPDAQEVLELPPQYQSDFWKDGSEVGTPAYMSPEQASRQNSKLDRRSDVYGLGTTLYSLIVGRSAFHGVPKAVFIEKVKTGDFKKPRQANPSVHPALEAICLKAMSLKPEDRYNTALDLARDLERWLDDEPTIAYPEPWHAKAVRWVRRHKTTTVGVASVLVCAVIGLSVLDVQMAWAKAEIDAKARDLFDSKVETERNFQLALEAVNQLLIRIEQLDLARIPRTENLRRQIAVDATKYLNDLNARKPESPWMRFQVARGYRELAKIKQLLGDKAAIPDYERAIDLLRGAVVPGEKLAPGNQDYLAETLIDLAEMLRVSGEPSLAEPLYLDAIKLATELTEEHPSDPRYQFTLASARCNFAQLRMDIGKYQESIVLGKQAVERLRGFADAKPRKDNTQSNARVVLPFVLVNLGAADRETGNLDAAEEVLNESIRRVEESFAEADSKGVFDSDALFAKALALHERGRTEILKGSDFDQVSRTFQEALVTLETLTKEFPQFVQYRLSLSNLLLDQGSYLIANAKPVEGVAAVERARKGLEGLLTESPGHPIYSGVMGRVLGEIGRLELKNGETAKARDLLELAVKMQEIALKANAKNPADNRAKVEHQESLKVLVPSEGKQP